MPNPPDQPTKLTPAGDPQTQLAATEATETAVQAPLPLNADVARVLEEQVDTIAQRQVYHSQMMFGVSGIGTDPVSGVNVVRAIANALRNGSDNAAIYALVHLGDPQTNQINDHTTPFNFNPQIAGLLEGILVDTIRQAYRDDPERQQEARSMLERIFVEANEQMTMQPKAMLAFQAPGPRPNARA
jgi:hypothetical protein